MKNTGTLTSSQSRKIFAMLLCTAAVAGIIAGSVYGSAHSGALPLAVHQCFLTGKSGNTAFEVMRNTFLSSAVFLLACYFSGLFALGQPIGISLLIYRGFGIGASSAALYSAEGAGAAAKVTFLLMPGALASVGVAVLAVRELLRVSTGVLSLWVTGELRAEKLVDLRLYSIKFAVLLLLSLMISIGVGTLHLALSGL